MWNEPQLYHHFRLLVSMALHRETTFKNTRNQYLTDHLVIHAQPRAMRPMNLGRRHGKGWGGEQHKLRQKC